MTHRSLPLLIALLASALLAGEKPLEFSRLDLTDGRSLRNVVIKTYDPTSDKVLLIADGKAMSIPRTLVPPPFANQLKKARRSGEFMSTVAVAPASDQYQLSRPVPARQGATPPAVVTTPGRDGQRAIPPPPFRPTSRPPARTTALPPTSNQALAHSQTIDLNAHRAAALDRARKYYRYEFRVGSDSALAVDVEIELGPPKLVPGWEGRCRAEGKAYLQTYDSRGGSFQRRTSTFEVVTERKTNDDEILIVDFTPKT